MDRITFSVVDIVRILECTFEEFESMTIEEIISELNKRL